ncbi:MAG TPA: ferric reductase-like transmembrane domain-containing protein, partial [Ktedonobacteraceae bacterium]|nr:ferric reductase-like transmembrane domain-containing protein [Ktedonobacteraceae bacterium]
GSKFNLICLGVSLIVYGSIYVVYLKALKSQPYAGPYSDPLRLFGIVAFCLVLLVAAYTLRRRFVRTLPGKVQNWLWLHTWFGVLAILIAFLHENYLNILRDFQFTRMRFTEGQAGTLALYALLLLVISGIAGRLLDAWQARTIAQEANSNGAGIIQVVQERLHELELAVERLSAGKSPTFKIFCSEALRSNTSLPAMLPVLTPKELDDFERVYAILTQRAYLARSLQRQKRARLVIRVWRYVHIPLACLALVIISYHSFTELLKMLVHR